MSESAPDIIIWDMGGIMYRFFTELMLEIGKRQGWPLPRLPLGPTGPGADPFYLQMDRGEMTEPEYLRCITSALAKEGIEFAPYEDLDFSTGERIQTWGVIEHLKVAGFRQALLTNDASAWLGNNWWEKWPHVHRVPRSSGLQEGESHMLYAG